LVHGPVADAAHSTVATLPGTKLVHVNSPLFPNELTIGACPSAPHVARQTTAAVIHPLIADLHPSEQHNKQCNELSAVFLE
jgi:hypothetical protein